MSKNKLSEITSKKEATAEDQGAREAARAMVGKDPWEGKNKDDRISMRIESDLKEAYRNQLPEFANITDAIRKHMIRVARGEEKV